MTDWKHVDSLELPPLQQAVLVAGRVETNTGWLRTWFRVARRKPVGGGGWRWDPVADDGDDELFLSLQFWAPIDALPAAPAPSPLEAAQ